MALFDGPDTVTVYPEETVQDSYGNTIRRPSAVGVQVRCRMQQISDSRDPGSDRRLGAQRAWRFSARTAPIGRWSRVVWGDIELAVMSGPFVRSQSPGTSRVVATLAAQE